ncbi:hypothetical protein KUF71_014652 [Frankliniella fusca]|uniref:Uncharacterized protein n=1 Tax=Frankliniella fusca TaxID=407009 RepID=A0AAE1LNZ4_9NEOP|nr:hypothetical protein KUF71_014652 [Frankliniella fusca]
MQEEVEAWSAGGQRCPMLPMVVLLECDEDRVSLGLRTGGEGSYPQIGQLLFPDLFEDSAALPMLCLLTASSTFYRTIVYGNPLQDTYYELQQL